MNVLNQLLLAAFRDFFLLNLRVGLFILLVQTNIALLSRSQVCQPGLVNLSLITQSHNQPHAGL